MKRVLLFLSLLVLANCGGKDVPFIPPIGFSNEAPIALTVATVQVVDEYVPPKQLPNVEHAAPTPPYRAVHLWADQRLKADGTNGYLRVGIKDASIVQKSLIGQMEYDGHLDVTLDADAGDGLHSAAAEVTVSRQITTDKKDDLADKERIWDQLTREMMSDFDKSAANAIRTNLGAFTGTPGMPIATQAAPSSGITATPLQGNGASGNY